MKPENQSVINAPTGSSAPSPALPQPGRAPRRSRYLVIGGVAVALAAGLTGGIAPRLRAAAKLAATAREVVATSVNVTNASRASRALELTLPGDVHAQEETSIHARADGYLLKWHTDIGAKVEAGQILAVIDSPELDQELNQSRAALAQAQANRTLARSSAERWQALLKERAVSQQEVDEKAGALAARDADVNAAQAVVTRLESLAAFKEVRAPFAGTITRRLVDTGALIRVGGNGGTSALFQLARTETLRVHVNVPQAYLRDIKTGAPAQVRVAEYPDRAFAGQVVRTSGAFDPGTRTLLTEIEVPNRDGSLFPGIHVDVKLSLAQANPPIVVPAASVINRGDGPQVVVLDEHQAIHWRKIQPGRDLGRTVEIVGGVDEGALIVTNPTEGLLEGSQVKVATVPSVATPAPKLARR